MIENPNWIIEVSRQKHHEMMKIAEENRLSKQVLAVNSSLQRRIMSGVGHQMVIWGLRLMKREDLPVNEPNLN